MSDIKKKKKERKKKERKNYDSLKETGSFIFFFMILEATRYTQYQSYRQHKGDTMEMKSKLYLQIVSVINYIMEENLFFNA